MTDTPIEIRRTLGGRIEPVELQVEMQRSYIDYAMTVIVGRALPDVRDGLKPVHRRVLYAMYDGGYRPDRGFCKCARVVGEVMGQYHPHGDSAIYDTLVRLAQPWVMRAPLVDSQGNFGSPGNDPAAAMRYTECKMAPLAMEMVRDIDEETVDFAPNYDGRSQEPSILPARFPNLLVNGSAGIAVGMATNIPPHNLREVAEGVQWALAHPEAEPRGAARGAAGAHQGPRLPDQGADRGPAGHRAGLPHRPRLGDDARGRRRRRGRRGRTQLVITELPYQVNPDNLAMKIAELADSGKIQGIADVKDNTSRAHRPAADRRAQARRGGPGGAQQPVQAHRAADQLRLQHAGAGRRRAAHADARPVRRPLGRPTSSRSSSGAPATGCARPRSEAHILRGLVKALDALDEVIALIRRSPDVDDARAGPDGRCSTSTSCRRAPSSTCSCAGSRPWSGRRSSTTSPSSSGSSPTSRTSSTARSGSGRSSPTSSPRSSTSSATTGAAQIIAADGDLSMEDLIPDEDLVVTITRGGYAKRTRADLYRTQKRGRQGRARRDAARRRRRRALHGDQQPPLAAVLHHRRPGLPHQGLQPAGGVARRQGRARGRAAELPARRAHRAGAGDPRLRAGAVPRAGHPQRPGQEDPARRLQLARARPASSRSTSATTTTS